MKKIKVKRMFVAVLAMVTMMVAMSAFAMSGDSKSFKKTKNRCSTCSCSGYWGYKHQNGTYEGNCSNTDQYGHKCGHGPEKHGLRKW